MSTLNLLRTKGAQSVLAGLTNEGKDVYNIPADQAGNYYQEFFSQAVPSYTVGSSAQKNYVTLDFNRDDVYELREVYLEWLYTETGGSNSPTFFNVFSTIQEIRLFYNKKQVHPQLQLSEILCNVSNAVHDNKDKIGEKISMCRTELPAIIPTYAGENCAVSSTLQMALPLSWLFPELKEKVIAPAQNGLNQIQVMVIFQTNKGSTPSDNGLFVKSSTTSNAYGANLTLSNIQLRACVMVPSAPARSLLLARNMPVEYIKMYKEFVSQQSWNTPGTDQLVLKFKDTWGTFKNVSGVYCFIDPYGLRTAFNDSDSCQLYSGATYICPKVTWGNLTTLDHSNPTGDLHNRRRYNMEVARNKYGCAMPLDVIDRSTGLPKYYYIETYIDLQNIIVHNEHEGVVSGLDTDVNNLTITLYCGSAVSTSCNVYAVLEYNQLINVNNNGVYQTTDF